MSAAAPRVAVLSDAYRYVRSKTEDLCRPLSVDDHGVQPTAEADLEQGVIGRGARHGEDGGAGGDLEGGRFHGCSVSECVTFLVRGLPERPPVETTHSISTHD